MTTYTLPVSEGLAARLASLPAEKVNAVNAELTDLLEEMLEEGEPINPADYPLTAGDIAAIREGLAESDAGLAVDGKDVIAKAFARFSPEGR